MLEEGFAEYQNRKVAVEVLARQEVRNKCVLTHMPSHVLQYVYILMLCVLFFIAYFVIVCHVLCDI